MSHPFWLALLIACIVWYSTITLYVSYEGLRDIRKMLSLLAERDKES